MSTARLGTVIRLAGHALQTKPGPRGESVCECGAMSLHTGVNGGRRWHRRHKLWILEDQAKENTRGA